MARGTVTLVRADGSEEQVEVARVVVDLGDGATLWVEPATPLWWLGGHPAAPVTIMGGGNRGIMQPHSSNAWYAAALPITPKVSTA